jgi:hypothetical protein
MTIPLPRPIPSTSQWQLQGYRRVSMTSPPAAGGIATARFGQLGTDEQWLIDRAVVSCSSTSGTTVRLYDGDPSVSRLLSGSNTGNYDEADYPQGLLLDAGGELVAVWSGAGDGAVGTISVQARILRRT